MTRNFGLRYLFFAITAAAIVTICCQYVIYLRSPVGRYSEFKDGHALMAVLTLEIQNGDHFNTIRKKIGNGHELTDKESVAIARETVLRNKREKPTYCPDGLQESDKFFEYYFAPGGAMRLQFRDERLVNHIVSPQTAAFFRNQISQ